MCSVAWCKLCWFAAAFPHGSGRGDGCGLGGVKCGPVVFKQKVHVSQTIGHTSVEDNP